MTRTEEEEEEAAAEAEGGWPTGTWLLDPQVRRPLVSGNVKDEVSLDVLKLIRFK